MTQISHDDRSAERCALDERIAAEPQLPPTDLPVDAEPMPLEWHLSQLVKPMAVAGIVENGVVRIVDPSVSLPEHARVIVIAAQPS